MRFSLFLAAALVSCVTAPKADSDAPAEPDVPGEELRRVVAFQSPRTAFVCNLIGSEGQRLGWSAAMGASMRVGDSAWQGRLDLERAATGAPPTGTAPGWPRLLVTFPVGAPVGSPCTLEFGFPNGPPDRAPMCATVETTVPVPAEPLDLQSVLMEPDDEAVTLWMEHPRGQGSEPWPMEVHGVEIYTAGAIRLAGPEKTVWSHVETRTWTESERAAGAPGRVSVAPPVGASRAAVRLLTAGGKRSELRVLTRGAKPGVVAPEDGAAFVVQVFFPQADVPVTGLVMRVLEHGPSGLVARDASSTTSRGFYVACVTPGVVDLEFWGRFATRPFAAVRGVDLRPHVEAEVRSGRAAQLGPFDLRPLCRFAHFRMTAPLGDANVPEAILLVDGVTFGVVRGEFLGYLPADAQTITLRADGYADFVAPLDGLPEQLVLELR